MARPKVVETRSIGRLYIRGSKAKEERKKGSNAKGYRRPYITPPGHMASLRSVAVFAWPKPDPIKAKPETLATDVQKSSRSVTIF
jgi:hypothetical protein